MNIKTMMRMNESVLKNTLTVFSFDGKVTNIFIMRGGLRIMRTLFDIYQVAMVNDHMINHSVIHPRVRSL